MRPLILALGGSLLRSEVLTARGYPEVDDDGPEVHQALSQLGRRSRSAEILNPPAGLPESLRSATLLGSEPHVALEWPLGAQNSAERISATGSGALMDRDHFRTCLQLVQVVGPGLHHLAPFRQMWSDITRVQFLEFQPSSPDQYLAVQDDAGELKMWSAGQPQSWAKLLAQSQTLDRDRLPEILWERREMIPYLPLLVPYRLTATLGHAIDTVATDPRPGA